MAEKYGEIPPKFTKQWWEYFWEYYKWHVIITVAAVIIAAVTIVQCATREKYDMTVVYAGHMNYSEGEIQRFKSLMEECISDIDSNGKQSVDFQHLVFSDGAGNEEFDYAMQTKLDMTFTDDFTYVYLMDEIEAKLYIQRKSVSEGFEPADVFAKDTDAEILRAEDGTGYAVNLNNSSILRENNIYCDDLYLFIRVNSQNDEKSAQSYNDALNIAKKLIK